VFSRAGLDAMVKIRMACPCRESNPYSSAFQAYSPPLYYGGIIPFSYINSSFNIHNYATFMQSLQIRKKVKVKVVK
jgi:hypothetical protein